MTTHERHRAKPNEHCRGPYKLDHIRTKVSHLHIDIRKCYVDTEFDPVDHVYVLYFLKITQDGTVRETGAPGTNQRSVELNLNAGSGLELCNWETTGFSDETLALRRGKW
jgi:hypothetical protein